MTLTRVKRLLKMSRYQMLNRSITCLFLPLFSFHTWKTATYFWALESFLPNHFDFIRIFALVQFWKFVRKCPKTFEQKCSSEWKGEVLILVLWWTWPEQQVCNINLIFKINQVQNIKLLTALTLCSSRWRWRLSATAAQWLASSLGEARQRRNAATRTLSNITKMPLN